MNTWGGRFTQGMDEAFERFNASLSMDRRLILEDIEGSMAYAEALEQAGVLSPQELRRIQEGLGEIRDRAQRDRGFLAEAKDEDVHSFVEARLVEIIGEAGMKLHTGRSRNDQVALDTRLFLKKAIGQVQQGLKGLMGELLGQARRHRDLVIPGYTHLRKAQPILLAHYLLAWFEMFSRDRDRFEDCFRRTDCMPLGAGALAGNAFGVDREALRKKLNFSRITSNSLDAVSDRDYLVDFVGAGSLTLVHLSRLAEDLIFFSTPECGWIELSDEVTTGSSLMPQKKNPDSLELLRGKSGRVIGNLTRLLVLLKGLPLTYNKDLQEDKEALFDTLDTLLDCLQVAQAVVRTLEVDAGAARKALEGDFMTATDLADYLVRKGMPFREAHGLVGRIVLECEGQQIGLSELPLSRYREFSSLFAEDLFQALSVRHGIEARSVPGGTAPERVAEALSRAEQSLTLQNPSERGTSV
ncbi:MAG: argininosuccinate lyase [Acidobacteria bacterium]|nr:argininosuccinate lyase [Acidobacteriota bacterium]